MNKKIVLSLLLFLVIFFYKPSLSLAQVTGSCTTRPTLGCTPAIGMFQCSAGSGLSTKLYCCPTQTACDQVTQGTALGNQLVGKTDPSVGCGTGSVNTAIGCIGFQDTDSFVGTIFKWSVGIGGGVAFLLIVFGGFLIMTSTGNPERLQQGKEVMTSAISGVILLILSIFVLRVIGVDILKIPGFGGSNSVNVMRPQ